MTEDDEIEIRPEDALAVAQRALQKANELDELREENAELRERVAALEALQEDSAEYDRLDRDTKVGMVREHLIERARQQHGKAAIDYDDVMWEVFDGEPSADHCYTLMELAAQATGFYVQDPANDNRRLVVNTDALNAQPGFSRANKTSTEGVR